MKIDNQSFYDLVKNVIRIKNKSQYNRASIFNITCYISNLMRKMLNNGLYYQYDYKKSIRNYSINWTTSIDFDKLERKVRAAIRWLQIIKEIEKDGSFMSSRKGKSTKKYCYTIIDKNN